VALLGAAAESLFATVFPSDCRLCNVPLTNISRLPVCESCIRAIQPIDGLVCGLCGERLTSRHCVSLADGIARCGNCEREAPRFAKAVAYGSYEAGLRELIHLLKYEQVRPAANVLGRMLGDVISSLTLLFEDRSPIIVPIPLHASKLRQRGFNQSELIARAALKHRALCELRVNVSALERCRATESQTGLTRAQRRENIRGAFHVRRPEQIAGRAVVLVDDVFTTGTTVSECARVLYRAGAATIWVATVARVLKSDATLGLDPDEEVIEGAHVLAAGA